MDDISLFDAIRTQRGIKRFTPDPVPQEAIETILKAAIRAPSAGNRQPWFFVVIKDTATKLQLAEWYRQAMEEALAAHPETAPGRRNSPAETSKTISQPPVLIVPCLQRRAGAEPPQGLMPGASIYPAVQNILLAARALGLGTTITGFHSRIEPQVRALLGIPDDADIAAIIPLGWPAEGYHFGGSRRKPITEVTFYDRWGHSTPSS